MRKFFALTLSLLLLCALFAGCNAEPMAQKAPTADDAYYDYNNASRVYASAPMEDYEYLSEPTGGELSLATSVSNTSVAAGKKIIRDADCALTVVSATEAWAQIVAKVTEAGGYVSASNQWQVNEIYTSITATIRIPAGKLDSALDFLGSVGEVTNLSISSNDVTDAYTDTQLRLDVKRASLEQYYKYLEDAKNVQEMLNIQREINKLIEEIESAEGRIRMWDNLVSESTLKIRIYEEKDPTAERREVEWNAMTADDVGYHISNGFIGVVKFLWAVVQWIVIILAVTSPLWIIALAIIIPLVIRRKRRKAKKARLAAEAAAKAAE
ncbi:MAG: DUF4349 domain-containing protein [Clostridiales bacterium]|nr:DUF4349 domain-containing protein [Clostridiales bacterium]